MNRFCPRQEHLSRRALLKGALGTTAGAAVLNWGHLTQSALAVEQAQRSGKRCILFWLNGGCSQFETFDMKVGRPTGGPFRPIQTNLPGVEICELMPTMARMMDQITVIRSMRTSQIDHPGGIHLMHCAYAESAGVRYPEIGAVVAKYLGQEKSDLPNFIKISSQGHGSGGFLGPQYRAFELSHSGQLPTFSESNLPAERELRRHGLREFLEDRYAQQYATETIGIHREGYAAARRLQKVLDVFNTDAEWESLKTLYGESLVGRHCMLARKLVEAGVPFVEVGQSSYDTHADNFTGHKGLVPPMDQAWGGLLTDLKQRGLLEDTLVIWMGEIGRTPNINNRAGRDHYVRSWSTALAGCGIKAGLVYGASDEDGRDVKDNPVTEGDFFATVYKTLGIDPTIENYNGLRPIPIAPFGSNVVTDLIA